MHIFLPVRLLRQRSCFSAWYLWQHSNKAGFEQPVLLNLYIFCCTSALVPSYNRRLRHDYGRCVYQDGFKDRQPDVHSTCMQTAILVQLAASYPVGKTASHDEMPFKIAIFGRNDVLLNTRQNAGHLDADQLCGAALFIRSDAPARAGRGGGGGGGYQLDSLQGSPSEQEMCQ